LFFRRRMQIYVFLINEKVQIRPTNAQNYTFRQT
jgi:hypothetical protein